MTTQTAARRQERKELGIARYAREQITLREMSEPEAAWVGAMLDAEGSIRISTSGYPTLQVVNTNPEILSALLRATGIGRIYWRKPSVVYQARLPVFQWLVQQRDNARALLTRIQTYSMKAQRALESV
jgi:hypothetical protein